MRKLIIVFAFIAITITSTFGQDIKLNQIGFYKYSPKIAVIPEAGSYIFQVISAESEEIVYSGLLSNSKQWHLSGEENIRIADFSEIRDTGEYYLQSGDKRSHIFKIANDTLYKELALWSTKAFYLWRASTSIDSAYATFRGINYSRNAGHTDTIVYIHSEASSPERPEGTIISSPKGWYDAGDYNKYVVNANQAVFPLLHAYELYPDYYNNLNLNIPESENNVPDILDEVKWELDWLLTMQDPNDGGVYHKLTHLTFSPSVIPEEATSTRFLMKKSTAASLDFAAMLSKAYRIYKNYDSSFPGFADSCLHAAEYAYRWASNNPEIYYTNPSNVNTGSYGDSNLDDEFFWAKIELYLATNDTLFLHNFDIPSDINAATWPNVAANGLLSFINVVDTLQTPSNLIEISNILTTSFQILSDKYLNKCNNSPYKVGIDVFQWGSNGYASSIGTVLISAFNYYKDEAYLNASLSMLDYILGRNATPYCFVTGFGDHSTMNPHDRRSYADGITEPLPGYIAGGPNNGHQSRDCGTNSYPSTYEAKSYVDKFCSYSTNEIAINWNAPFSFLVNAIEAEFQNSSISPELILTDTIGTTVNIMFPEAITIPDLSSISFSIFNTTQSYTISNTNIDSSSSIITITLSDTISSEDTVFVSSDFTNVFYESKPIRNIQNKEVVNCTNGALPVVLSATTDSLGHTVTLTFSKDLSLSANETTGLVVTTNENNNITQSYYVDSTNRQLLHILTDIFYSNDMLTISYDTIILLSSEGSTILPFELNITENRSSSSPSLSILDAVTHDDGYKIELFFNKSVQIDESVTEPITTRYNTEDVTISNYSYNDFSVLVEFEQRYSPTDQILINSNTNFMTNEGEIAEIFSDFEVTNKLTQLYPTSISSSEETQLILYDYQYLKNIDILKYGSDYRMRYISDESWIDIPVDVINPALYSIRLYYSSPTENQNLSIIDFSNETESIISSYELPTTYYSTTWRYMDTTISLEEGEKLLRFRADSSIGIVWISFQVQNDDTTSIKNKISTPTKLISPSPCNGTFTITTIEDSNVKIFTANGIPIIEEKLPANTEKSYTLSTAGIYFITINDKIYKQIVE